jgi:hypothetical protein
MSAPPQNQRLELSEAIRRYWTNLIGVALFPSVFFLSVGPLRSFLSVSGQAVFACLIPFFFAVSLHAGWPYLRHRAPYTFWLVACAVWMAGGVLGLILLGVINAIIA